MTERSYPRWARFRRIFRRFRIAILSVVASFCFGLLWFNYVGFPGWVRERVMAELRRNNLDLNFATLRLSGFFRIVADQVTLKTLNDPLATQFGAGRAEFHLKGAALLRGDFELQELLFKKGSLLLPLSTNLSDSLEIKNVQSLVEFPAPDHLSITTLEGDSMGLRFSIGGYMFNFSEVGRAIPGKSAGKALDWRRQLSQALVELRKLQFAEPPEIQAQFSIDGKGEHPAMVNLDLRMKQPRRAGLRAESGAFHFELNPSQFTNSINLSGHLDFENPRAGKTKAARVALLWTVDWPVTDAGTLLGKATLQADSLFAMSNSVPNPRVELEVTRLGTNLLSIWTGDFNQVIGPDFQWQTAKFAARSTNGPIAQMIAQGLQPLEELALLEARYDLSITQPRLQAAQAEGVTLTGVLGMDLAHLGTNGMAEILQHAASDWRLQATNIVMKKVQVDALTAAGAWNSPELEISSLKFQLYNGMAETSGRWNSSSRQLSLRSAADFDYHKLEPLLPEQATEWLNQITWEQPPKLEASLSLQLPKDLRSAEAGAETLRSLSISGGFAGRAALQGVAVDWAQSHFSFTNYLLNLPDLEIHRADGYAALAYEGNVTNLNFHCYLNSHLQPGLIKPLLEKEQRDAMEMVEFDQAPEIEGDFRGNWKDLSQAGFDGKVRTKDFWVKDEKFSDIETRVHYTNMLVTCEDLLAHREQEEVRAPWLQINPAAGVILVTNVFSTMNPYVAMKLVGDEILRVIEPYQFATPPTIKINGIVPLGDPHKADIHYELAGTDFTYWKFHMPEVTGDIYWKGTNLWITNVHAAFYKGNVVWSGHFVFPDEKDSADFSFDGATTNADLTLLMDDLQPGHQKLEGSLSGRLTITQANSDDFKTWNGHGHAELKNGFLWDVPVFGLFTPALEAIMPGLALSRVSSGTADFQIKNSVISTKNLQVHAPAFRLKYDGKIDFDGNLDAQVEALILRDTRFFGRVVSMALWPVSKVFEGKISGTLENPKTKLKHFPKAVTAPLKTLNAAKEVIRNAQPKKATPADHE